MKTKIITIGYFKMNKIDGVYVTDFSDYYYTDIEVKVGEESEDYEWIEHLAEKKLGFHIEMDSTQG